MDSTHTAMRRHSVQLPPSDVNAVAREWLKQPPHIVLEAVKACAHRPVALPFFHAGVRWPVGDVEGRPIADLRSVAEAASQQLPSSFFAHVMRIGGLVSHTAFGSAVGLPCFRNALRVRRPDLFWFVAACHHIVRRASRAAQAAVNTASTTTWVVAPGTLSATAVRQASAAADVRFASPGRDIVFCRALKNAGVAMAPRDKMIVLCILLFAEDFRWSEVGAPPCSPPPIRAAATALIAAAP